MKKQIKLIILTALAIIHFCAVNGQNTDKTIMLSDTKFEVFKGSTAIFDNANKNPSALYLKVDLPKNVKDNFYKLSKTTIMQLLHDPATDWATNLLLYEKYKKDAYLFLEVIHARKDWLPLKKNDIAYWKKYLK